MAAKQTPWQILLSGIGRTFWPDPGNQGNAPSPSLPVQAGNYEYIIPQMYPSPAIVNVPYVPTFFQDWAAYGVNGYGISGLEGGGATGDVPQITNGPTEYFDTETGLYYGMGSS